MAGLDDLYSQIPVADIASRLGAPEGEVNQAIQTLVPTLVGSIQHNVVSDDIDSSSLESAIASQAGSRLLEGGVNVDQVDTGAGEQFVARIFGGNDTNQVASALAGSGAGGGDLIKKLLPILIPIVLAYLGKQAGGGSTQAGASGGGLGDVLGSILGGAGGGAGGGNNPLGSILGNVLGGKQGGAIGDILGGLLGGKK
ncbi:hypothetical protein Y900_022045 [Mycolicibacterium aromaticivorans JS19b1 = JCM 16368]|uniref:DUF937 domain-containing protein n=1 Tax=Mycolicibacterium aromaticivorans JS19b1 = JCM 16368 TaxID=1440774 RepID=A0A064CLT1_9MYCO|nr:DUF937 domain-containing protein [Mycolicibacterium aromaticivorans]KDF01540.1 hypothetical protein Y900_022045 [Mycolicibacterium aromaticivorans JS19b1 = JCM 16368]